VMGQECAFDEAKLITRIIWVRRSVETLIVLVAAPEAARSERPAGQAGAPGVRRRLPGSRTRRIAVLTGDVRGCDEPGDLRRNRRWRLAELLLPTLRRVRSG